MERMVNLDYECLRSTKMLRAILCFLVCVHVSHQTCPCSEKKLCDPITDKGRKEVFVFSIQNNASHWNKYDWSKITTVVMFGYINDTLMCLAHSHNARVVIKADCAKYNFASEANREMWILDKLTTVRAHYLDGINFDFESEIDQNDTETKKNYTLLVKETKETFKELLPHSQVTVDVAWKANTDKRFYDYSGLAAAADFLFVMAYDEQSQIFGECVAGPNSDYKMTEQALEMYTSDKLYNITREKLVLGLPWYGYYYPCLDLQDDKCFLKQVPFRGVNCSDAAGRQYDYRVIYQLLKTMPDKYRWNVSSSTPYITVTDKSQESSYQVQFDDPKSLSLKYQMSVEKGLRGVGMWNIDSLDYAETEDARLIRQHMFDALPNYNKTRPV